MKRTKTVASLTYKMYDEKETTAHRFREQTGGYQRGRGGDRTGQITGVMSMLSCVQTPNYQVVHLKCIVL